MSNPWLFYLVGIILIILGLIDVALMTYSGHASNGILVSVWGVAALVWGVRNELLRRK